MNEPLIKLDGVRTVLQREKKSGQRVFQVFARRPAMRDTLEPGGSIWHHGV